MVPFSAKKFIKYIIFVAIFIVILDRVRQNYNRKRISKTSVSQLEATKLLLVSFLSLEKFHFFGLVVIMRSVFILTINNF